MASHKHQSQFLTYVETQCMSGFLYEDSLRNKSALIGRTVTRQKEQVIVPEIKFTCSGTLSKWIFVAESLSGRGRNRYPELQVWRPQSTEIYDIVHRIPITPASTSQSNVYTHTISTPIQYQAGDVLGIYHPPADASAYKIYSVEHGGPDNYHMGRQESARVQFDLQSSDVGIRRDYPLVGAETSQFS